MHIFEWNNEIYFKRPKPAGKLQNSCQSQTIISDKNNIFIYQNCINVYTYEVQELN